MSLELQAAPLLRRGVTTPGLMIDVVIAVAPVTIAALYFFGLSALLLLLAATAGCLLAERLWGGSLADGSTALTGVLLGLTLPPTLPLWMAFVGGLVAIGLGKAVWGGLGNNLFNPALVGRAFLQAAFPIAMTTWSKPGPFFELRPGNLALPLMQAADVTTSATPLAQMKFQHAATPVWSLISGNTSGSIGETSAALIVLGAVWLIARRTCDWRVPVGIVVTVAALAGVLTLVGPERFPDPASMVLSGGLLFGAVYMATDPVTSPMAPKGAWVFAIGVGALVVLIRVFGGLPEGVMYAILLMNSATPLIERVLQPVGFGRAKEDSGG